MWFLLIVGLDVVSVIFVGATARAGRAMLPGLHVAVASVMVVMALFGGIPWGRALLPIVLIGTAAAVLVRRGRCSTPTCWHLIACAVGMGVLALEMPASLAAPAANNAMAGMTGMASRSGMGSMGSTGTLGTVIGWIVLISFGVLSVAEAVVLLRRLTPAPSLTGRRRAVTLERCALLTGSLAMVAMAASMLAGAAAPLTT
jgi:hypothetical protein